MQDEQSSDPSLTIMALLSRGESALMGIPSTIACASVPEGVHTSPGVSSRQALAYARLSQGVCALSSAMVAHILPTAANNPVHVPQAKRAWRRRLVWMFTPRQPPEMDTHPADRVVRIAKLTITASYVMLALHEAWIMANRYGHGRMAAAVSASIATISMALDSLQTKGNGFDACHGLSMSARALAAGMRRPI